MIVAKEEVVGCEKYMRAYKLGKGEAIMMWWALKGYASKHTSTEGFIPDEDIDGLVGAPRQPRKALQALVDCGGLLRDGTRGAGLVDPVEGGWQLHDYADHAAAPEEIELRREKARVKKQRQRAEARQQLEQLRTVREAIAGIGQEGDVSPGQAGDKRGTGAGTTEGDTPRDQGGTSLAGARPPTPARPRVPSPALSSPPHPNFKTPDPDCPDRASARDLTWIAPEQRRFAADNSLDLDALAKHVEYDAEFSQDPRSATHAGRRHALSKLMVDAAAVQERLGGAA